MDNQVHNAIVKYYHDLSDKYKKMIPLKMVYIPVAKDEQE